MKKICIALVSALAFGVVNAEETDLVVVGSGGAGLSRNKARKLSFSRKCRLSAETHSAAKAV